jgi:hypothetical protein
MVLAAGSKWRHYKGGEYVVLGLAEHTEEEALLVIYQSLGDSEGKAWARPAYDWFALVRNGNKFQERFVEV